MPKLVYAEPDDEITNLVDRLRSEKTEKELVFVLPAASRVLHSSLNARLLMQYSHSLGKKTSVVSPDPRAQGVAIETGFDTFPTMAAFEAGHALDRAVEPRHLAAPLAAGALAGGGAGAGDIPAGPTRRSTAAPGPVTAPRPSPVAARPPAATAATAAAHHERRVGFLPWVLAAVGVFVIVMILLFFVLPSAIVTINVAARPVSVNPTITGSTAPPDPTSHLQVQTVLQTAEEQQQQQNVQSTGTKIIPAVAAKGTVTVGNNGSNLFCCVLQGGQTYEVSTSDGKKFALVPDKNYDIPPGSTQDFPVTARDGGQAGNVGAHTINSMTNAPPGFVIDNANPTQGGQDEQHKTVVGQADIDKVKVALGGPLTQKVKDDIKAKNPKYTVLTDTEAVDVSITTDHQPGDEVGNFNATVTAKGKATTVNEDQLKQVLLDALNRTVIAGYHLTNDQPKLTYNLVQHDDNGGAVWDGGASGFQATAVNESDLRSRISGKSPKDATAYVQGHIDALSATVSINPPFVPWLPFIGGNIHFREQVQNAAPTG